MNTIAGVFVRKYLPVARECETEYGVPPVFQLAQAALASSWGRNAPRFNFFETEPGLQWEGETQTCVMHNDGGDVPVSRVLRAYPDALTCWRDHAALLASDERYLSAFECKDDPVAFSDAVATAEYSADPRYGETMRGMITRIASIVAEMTRDADTATDAGLVDRVASVLAGIKATPARRRTAKDVASIVVDTNISS